MWWSGHSWHRKKDKDVTTLPKALEKILCRASSALIAFQPYPGLCPGLPSCRAVRRLALAPSHAEYRADSSARSSAPAFFSKTGAHRGRMRKGSSNRYRPRSQVRRAPGGTTRGIPVRHPKHTLPCLTNCGVFADSRRINCPRESCSLLHRALSNSLHSGRLEPLSFPQDSVRHYKGDDHPSTRKARVPGTPMTCADDTD